MEEGNILKKTEETVKLFVGQIPKNMTESSLLELFEEFALIEEVNIIKDKVTGASRGCCFVICPSRQEADKAIDACHNMRTLSGASSPLQVKYADGELERLEHKLFIGMLPKNVSESEVSDLFSKYGTIKELQILRGSPQTSKGCAFIKYETKEQALASLDSINGKYKMEGSNVPLVVKWADTEKERLARKAQKTQLQEFHVPNSNSVHPSLYQALPMGYIPPYNGYGYQARGTYGLMQYRVPLAQNQSVYHNMVPPGNQGNSLHGITPNICASIDSRNFAMTSASYVDCAYPSVGNHRYSMAYPQGMVNHRPLRGSLSPSIVNSYSPTSIDASSCFENRAEGPPGANLFIYHIPQEFGDEELAHAFEPFGEILSAKVFVDKATGASKCFGFVSYNSPGSAQLAISMMNGYQFGSKKLKVQLKRDNRPNKPH